MSTLLVRLMLAGTGAALLLVPTPAGAQDIFSPGPLTRPHASLFGLKQCTVCHLEGQGLSQEKCLECHAELRVPEGLGFHGRMRSAERTCEKCHHEHQGESASLIHWEPSKQRFPHLRTGFALEGKHAELSCDDCHQKRRVASPKIQKLLTEQPRRTTYLGLPSKCEQCHFDEHRAQLGQDCKSCHTEKAWAPAPKFDHGKTDYPLTGKHQKVACEKCHPDQTDGEDHTKTFPPPKRPQAFASYSDVEHQSCSDCHEDAHQGKFGPACSSCHVTAGWSQVRNPKVDRGFHDQTRFPLEGLHLTVACVACHGPFPGQKARFKGLAFKQCEDCHLDAHLGQLKRLGGGLEQSCTQCHTVEGFVPARFELENHDKTRFPLQGAHRAVGCAECHPNVEQLAEKVPLLWRKKLLRQKRPVRVSTVRFEQSRDFQRCESCHTDVHQGQFKTRTDGGACQGCHQVSSFREVAFDHARDSRFPLEGKHAQAPCGSCHVPSKDGKAAVRYRPLPLTCDGCHTDVHLGQFRQGAGTDCAKCHHTEDFRKVAFLHAPPFTSFVLDGAHEKVSCTSCHPEQTLPDGSRSVRYRPLPTSCEGCHQDFHHGAFEGFGP